MCLTEVHNAHSGVRPPNDITAAEITLYEAHLKNSFIIGMKDEIVKKVKDTCITWDTGKLNLVEQHAIRAEQLLTQEKDKQKLKMEQQAHKAQLTMMQMVTQLLEGGAAEKKEEEALAVVYLAGAFFVEQWTTGRDSAHTDSLNWPWRLDSWVIDSGRLRWRWAAHKVQNQVKAALPQPAEGNLHNLEPGDWIVVKDFRRKNWKAKRWLRLFQVLLTTQTVVEITEF
ncbi:uncharacterized protein [Chiloscyllium punctatum]|uniref:uncharacterized protein n=1 Tax=Chiloscyllium punctatum TaxID=137246 RepID=UPI003B63DB25